MSTINVNPEQCHHAAKGRPLHGSYCSAAPVLIPCPLPPTVEFTVRLGECTCISEPPCSCGASDDGYPHAYGCSGRVHPLTCSASPIRVTCSISGETWAESEVITCENAGRPDGMFVGADTDERALTACRERWALVKALVLNDTQFQQHHPKLADLFAKRDAVFAALAEMVRLEDALLTAQYTTDSLLDGTPPTPDHRVWASQRPSTVRLSALVQNLIDQAGRL